MRRWLCSGCAEPFGQDAVVSMMPVIQPKINRAVLAAHSTLFGNDFPHRLAVARSPLKQGEIEGLRFKGVHLVTGLHRTRKQHSGVSDVGTDVENISAAEQLWVPLD